MSQLILVSVTAFLGGTLGGALGVWLAWRYLAGDQLRGRRFASNYEERR